ncbi:MAG: glutaredoxin 2, partial [Bacteriovorax sp.]|nr:glutaredoxin 2 [Bacteriovorax sp.]
MKLYHYVHCPFCIRVRMGLGLFNIPYESHVLPYNDEATPKALTGLKMLPIFVNEKGDAFNESLDILKAIDSNDLLSWSLLDQRKEEIDFLLKKVGESVHSLCMPYWIWTPEFDESSRKYFQQKKEGKRGPFNKLIQNKWAYLSDLNAILEDEIEKNLSPFYKSSTLSILDIMIASHLWGMYIFPEFQFSPKVHEYLQTIKQATRFDYHADFWK